jgi:hypothetical protein
MIALDRKAGKAPPQDIPTGRRDARAIYGRIVQAICGGAKAEHQQHDNPRKERETMGTVNYKTSDIITLGLEPYEPRDFELDPDFMEDARRQSEEYGDDIDSIIYQTIADYTEDDRQTAADIISRYSFEFFTVTIEPGYYEGFSVNISNDLPCEYWDADEREQALTDAANLGDMLKELVNDACLCEVCPGWITTYHDTDRTLTDINKAIKGIIYDNNDTPDYTTEEAI